MTKLSALTGIWHRRTLLRLGLDDAGIRDGVEGGRYTRVARGWYAERGFDEQAAAALRAGGRLSCVAALRLHGAWVTDRRPHVRVARGKPAPPGPIAHRLSAGMAPPDPTEPIDPLDHALGIAFRCLDDEAMVVAVDSLLSRRVVDLPQARGIARAVSKRALALLDRVDGGSQSGTESIARLRLRALGLDVRTQVRIGIDRVDLLVGDRLVIECDSRSHHSRREDYAHDRERDLRLAQRGYTVLRFTYEQIMSRWPEVEEAIMTRVRAREHLWSARQLRLLDPFADN